jgi:signal transduction histidine kinase
MAGALEESYAHLEERVRERTAENQRLYEEAAERAQELAELNRRAIAVAGVAQEVGTLTRLDALLPAVSRRLRDAFGYSAVVVYLLDDATDELVPQGAAAEHTPRRLLGDGAVGRAAEEAATMIVADLRTEAPDEALDGSEIAVPIQVGDLVVGALDIRSPEPNAFDEADRFTVETFADQLAVAIENARLFEQTSDLAILEERNRFAREIHDTIAQGLTGIVLQLEATEQTLAADPEGAIDHLERARALARECLQDARRSVWNLLPDRLVENSLDEALDQEVARFSASGPEDGRLVVTGRPRALRRDVQSALLRIGQEAMTNARKHAEATHVSVEVAYLPGAVRLRVTDDGRGLDASRNGDREEGSGFGLAGMEQRVQQLFGTLDVRPAEGRGTVVEATIPAD